MSAAVDVLREAHGVEPTCRVLGVAPSTYYEVRRRHRCPSRRTLRDRELLDHIRRVHEANFGVYGVRKVWWQLQREGIHVARCTVERLMRHDGLEGAIRGKKRRTTIPGGQAERARDLVDRDFKASAPNRLWVSDFTHVAMWSGVAYVAFAIDAFSRRIVGWKADTTMKTSLVLDTLEMALWAVTITASRSVRASCYIAMPARRLDSTGPRNTVIVEVVRVGRPAGWMTELTGRAPMKSPGAPRHRLEVERLFWREIVKGLSSDEAAAAVGVSQAVGSRWFRERGGMPTFMLAEPSGRYLSFPEREEIAILNSQGVGVREIARRLLSCSLDDLPGAAP